ncbi:MAG: chorismate-binding protein, partial [bacterium]
MRVSVRGAEYVALSCLVTAQGGEEEVDRTVQLLESVQETPGGAWGRGEVIRALPLEQDWKLQVLEAEAACRSGELQKVVLARCVEVTTSVTPDGVLRVLSERYPTCTVFAVAREDATFLGATPETLVRVRRGRVWTQALAGTAPRGTDPDEDEVFRMQLVCSSK